MKRDAQVVAAVITLVVLVTIAAVAEFVTPNSITNVRELEKRITQLERAVEALKPTQGEEE